MTNRFITPVESSVQQWYSLGQELTFDLNTTGVSAVNADNLYLSFSLDFGERHDQLERFRYLGDLAVFGELALVRDKTEILHYPRYNVLASFVRNFLTERGDEAEYDDGAVVVAPDMVIDDRFRRSAHHLRYERLLLWAEPNAVLVCDGELRLRVARDWQEFVCSALPDFERTVRISNVRLYFEPTAMPPNAAKLPARYDVQLQFLTNTASRLTVHFDGEASSERYLFMHNDDVIRNTYDANFMRLPDDGGDAMLPRGDGVRFPLRFMKNPATKRVDVYATRKPFLSANEDFIGAGESSSYRWKLCTYVRPEHLRIVCDDATVVRDYGELEFSPRPAIDCHRAMLTSGKGNVQRRVKAMYPHTYVDVSPLELLLSHHFFVPVFQHSRRVSVQIARPVRLGAENSNFIASSSNDMLFCVSVVR